MKVSPIKKFAFLSKNIRRFASTKPSAYQGVVGLEVHAQILTESKLFSSAIASFGSHVNSCVAEFDAAIPGTLPVLNEKCVEAAIKTGLALNCDIAQTTMFDRKHYFYADMPAGYQITQQRHPIARNGFIEFPLVAAGQKVHRSEIIQIQIEQDSGKSLHDDVAGQSLVDLNRAGMPLLEFVFAPDLNDGTAAASLVKELCLILEKLGVSSCKMEEGALRVDANISIHPKGSTELGTRTEVKNIGSIRGVAHAVDFEIARQIALVQGGGRVTNETRNWDAMAKKTIKMRDKEVVLDYRFMPEPNLIPLQITQDVISRTETQIPELPKDTRKRLESDFKLPKVAVMNLVEDPFLLKLFEEILTAKSSRPPQLVSNILLNQLRAVCNENKISLENVKVKVMEDITDRILDQTININFVQKILEKAFQTEETVDELISKNNWKQIVDEEKIREICEKVLEENPKLVKQFKAGKEKLFFALVGIVSKKEEGRINMAKADQIMKKLLKKD